MRNFVKLFFTAVCFFISLTAVNAIPSEDFALQNSGMSELINIIQAPETEITIKPGDYERFIVCANNRVQEIFSAYQRKNNVYNSSPDKIAVQNKLANKFFNSKYNKLNNLKSHKISSYLSYEICTRAP